MRGRSGGHRCSWRFCQEGPPANGVEATPFGRLSRTRRSRRRRRRKGQPVSDPDADYGATYEYDEGADRLTKVKGPGLPNNGANYECVADSHLLWRTRFKENSTIVATTLRNYEEHRDLLTSVRNKWGSETRSFYQYANDELGRREWVYRDGTVFAGDHADVWQYDERNELTSSLRYNTFDPNSPGSPSDPNHAFDRGYGYDPIGNRDWSKTGTDPNTAYTRNNVNQYTATTNPSESFSYDADGNLTHVGGMGVSPVTYTWDAENRLTCVQTGDPNTPANGDTKVEFRYDYLGRRFEKKVSTHDGSGWNVTYTRRFVWSDWLPVLELDATDPNDVTILRKYTWGLDLSGDSIDGAGGIGGLLAAYDTNGTPGTTADDKSYLYFYDANGNVGQLLDRSDGSIAASYEYDAYGNNLLDPNDPNESGPYADDNPFRFSTKYFDDETGLGYWGYRHYSPRMGRWISRDPSEEADGPDLYCFVLNSPTRSVDSDGRRVIIEEHYMHHMPGLWGKAQCALESVSDPTFRIETQGCCHRGCVDHERRIELKCTIWIPHIGDTWGHYQIDQVAQQQIKQHEMGHVELAELLANRAIDNYKKIMPSCIEWQCDAKKALQFVEKREHFAWRITKEDFDSYLDPLVYNPPGHPSTLSIASDDPCITPGFRCPRFDPATIAWVTGTMRDEIAKAKFRMPKLVFADTCRP